MEEAQSILQDLGRDPNPDDNNGSFAMISDKQSEETDDKNNPLIKSQHYNGGVSTLFANSGVPQVEDQRRKHRKSTHQDRGELIAGEMLMSRKKKIDVRKMKVGQSMHNMGAALQKQTTSKDSEVTLSVVGKGNIIRATESVVEKDGFSYKDRNTLHMAAAVDDTKLAPSSDTATSQRQIDPLKGYDHLYKIIMLGRASSGKTSLLVRFVDDCFAQEG